MTDIIRTLEEARGTLQGNIDKLANVLNAEAPAMTEADLKKFIRKRKAQRGLVKYARYSFSKTGHGNGGLSVEYIDTINGLLTVEINHG